MRSFFVLSLLVASCTASLEPHNYGSVVTSTAKSIINPITLKPVEAVSQLTTSGIVKIGSDTQGNTGGTLIDGDIFGIKKTTGLTGTGGLESSFTREAADTLASTSGLIGSGGFSRTAGTVGDDGFGRTSVPELASGLVGTRSDIQNIGGQVSPGDSLVRSNRFVNNDGGLVNTEGQYQQFTNRGIINNANARDNDAFGVNTLDFFPHSTEYNTKFYMFSAPEEEEEEEPMITQMINNMFRNQIQVYFIQAPENNAASNVAFHIAKQAVQQKTAIYVLDKENDAAQVVGDLAHIQEKVSTPPDVKYIKYRTEGDAANARNQIQSQYVGSGGTSQVINRGVAPVLNYANSVPGSSTSGSLFSVPENVLRSAFTSIPPGPRVGSSALVPKRLLDPYLPPEELLTSAKSIK